MICEADLNRLMREIERKIESDIGESISGGKMLSYFSQLMGVEELAFGDLIESQANTFKQEVIATRDPLTQTFVLATISLYIGWEMHRQYGEQTTVQ